MKHLTIFLFMIMQAWQIANAQDSLQTKPGSSLMKHDKTYSMYHHGKEYFLAKSDHYKNAALVLAIAGPVMGISGYLVYTNNKNYSLDGTVHQTINTGFGVVFGAAMIVVGSLMTLGSIPLFVASSHYKQKAMKISAFIKSENCPRLAQANMSYKFYPAISIKL